VLNKWTILFAAILLSACTHSVHLVHVGDFKPYQKMTSGEKVESKAEQWVFLGFTQQTDYVNLARKELINKCQNGTIQGPVTRLSTSHGFFSWTNKIYIQGLCLKN